MTFEGRCGWRSSSVDHVRTGLVGPDLNLGRDGVVNLACSILSSSVMESVHPAQLHRDQRDGDERSGE
jgi:hypothetical protein